MDQGSTENHMPTYNLTPSFMDFIDIYSLKVADGVRHKSMLGV